MVLWLESEPVTADLTTTVVHVHSYKLLINDVEKLFNIFFFFSFCLLHSVDYPDEVCLLNNIKIFLKHDIKYGPSP